MPVIDTMKISVGNACFDVLIKQTFFNNNTPHNPPRLHCHPTYEVHCIEKGVLKFRFENSVRRVEGPAIVLIPPKFYHIMEYSSPDSVKYPFEFSLSMAGTGDSFRIYSDILGNVTAPEIVKVNYPSLDFIKRFESSKEEIHFMTYTHIGQIIVRLLNTLKAKYPESSATAHDKKSSFHKELVVAEIMSYMEQNAGSPLSLSDVTKRFNFSERQIERLLKEVMHDSFFSLLNKYRIRTAVIKISQGEDNLSKVAEECGFSNYVTFWNHFTKLNGMTPSEFQKRNDKNNVK